MDPEALLRDAFDAYVRRDVDALMAFLTDDVELVPALDATIEGRPLVGRPGLELFFGRLEEMWTDFTIELGEVTIADDRVLALGHLHARAAGSGVEFDRPVAAICEMRQGKIARWTSYLEPEDALTLFRERA
jgi:ketosteroid isomerase-like protein